MDRDGQLSILVVDDNPLNVKMLETPLAKEGYRIITANDGPDAREKAVLEHPDMILLDIKMPGENGFDVIKFLKNNASTASIPVLFLTGVSEINSKLEGFDLGAVDYITKPFHPLEVIARVGLHLKLSIATNSLIASQAEKLKQITEAQTSLLTTPDQHPKANFGVEYIALQEAGGDFYEVLPVSDEIYVYFIADFSGHDISTSYLTTSVKALLKQNCSPIYQPQESIKMINDVLVEILPTGKYLTASYVMLNKKKNQITIINAGHPPVCYIPVGGEPELIQLRGDVIGIFKDVLFGSRTIKVSKGDRFFLYTDGIIESSQKKIVWTEGADKILKACRVVKNIPIRHAPKKILEHICPDLTCLEDDIVILGFEV
ncbi:MAG: fused response regulator/phosphatase [Proteobacteria bacterium]|nr:fused response regulator/phosphatase [Pseudomonadota bacterium]